MARVLCPLTPCFSVDGRATVEFHGTDNMPPIRIVIADGEDNEDVVIKVRGPPVKSDHQTSSISWAP
jgi:hypothetical protein